MSWSRSTSIVTTLEAVTQLTGQQNISSLQDGSTDLETGLLLSASQEIYDRLVRDGHDPTGFVAETESAFQRTVAYAFLHKLGMLGHLGDYDDRRFEAEANKQYMNVRPKSNENSIPAGAAEALPGITNQGCGFFTSDYFSDDMPSVL